MSSPDQNGRRSEKTRAERSRRSGTPRSPPRAATCTPARPTAPPDTSAS